MLGDGPVPHQAKQNRGQEQSEQTHDDLSHHFGLGLRLKDLAEHIIWSTEI